MKFADVSAMEDDEKIKEQGFKSCKEKCAAEGSPNRQQYNAYHVRAARGDEGSKRTRSASQVDAFHDLRER